MFNSALPPPGSRALILGRYSSNLQNPLSADDQIATCKDDCKSFGWSVVEEFKDEAKSGRSVARRVGYLNMMAAAEAGRTDVICVFSLDRLGRNARELHDAKNRLADVDVVIYTHDRGVMSRIEFALYAEMAQMESEKIAERTTRGARAAAERGVFMGDIPYGVRVVAGDEDVGVQRGSANSRRKQARRLEIDPEEAKVVLRANLDFDAGISPHRMAIAFRKDGILSPEGNEIWNPNTIMGSKRSMTGLLRNPIYVGRIVYGKVKTALDPKTGRIIKNKGEAAQMIEHDAPWLRIVPQEVWDRNQERLAQSPASILQGRRRPSYLLSGLVKCGVCGGPYVLVTTKMGCTAHHLKACSNQRRVTRQDLERVVLEGLTDRIAQPQVINWFIPEYVNERGPASAEADDRHERAVQRLAEVGREIANVMTQVKSGAKGYAAQLLNDNLESLGAEKERLDRTVRAGPDEAPPPLTPDTLLARVRGLLSGLGEALEGDERDATRAKDIIRSLITKVTITPLEPDGRRPDGRGAGAVRVQVEGEISRLVDHAMLDRKIMHKRGATPTHDLPIATFTFYVDLTRDHSETQEGLWADVAVVGRLLDDAEYPVLYQRMIAAMNDRGRPITAEEEVVDERRARIALAQLRRDQWARAVRIGGTHGWVWDEPDISDDEWRERYDRRVDDKTPIGTFRISPPEAYVVVIGSKVG